MREQKLGGGTKVGGWVYCCTCSAAEESKTFHRDPLYQLYLNPTLQPPSHIQHALPVLALGWKHSKMTAMHWLNVSEENLLGEGTCKDLFDMGV